jgi:hypothetical protein
MDPNGGSSMAVVVALYAALTYDIISATNSSPQTTEINAKTRADTLMKWVHIGLAQAVIFVALGSILERAQGRNPWSPLIGGGLAGSMLYAQYIHAKQAGLESQESGTETTETQVQSETSEYEQAAI